MRTVGGATYGRLSGRPLLDTATDLPLFTGREAEVRRIRAAVRDGLNCLVVGERGSGRTSLLRRIARVLRDDGVSCAFVDAASSTDAAELLTLLTEQLLENGRPQRGRESWPGWSSAESVGEQMREAVRELSEGSAKLPHVVLLDSAPAAAAHPVFGQLRDELWQLPMTWVVSCSERERAAFLRPPADAFFDAVLALPALPQSVARDLVRRRISVDDLDDEALDVVVEIGRGNPRALLTAARQVRDTTPSRDGDESASRLDAAGRLDGTERLAAATAHRQAVLDDLGPAARMAAEELAASGPASASDRRLLTRLGWTRSRAAQVLGALERAGVVEATMVPNGPGRPRKVYQLVPVIR